MQIDLECTQARHAIPYSVDRALNVLDRVAIQIEVSDQSKSAQVRWKPLDVVIGEVNLSELSESR